MIKIFAPFKIWGGLIRGLWRSPVHRIMLLLVLAGIIGFGYVFLRDDNKWAAVCAFMCIVMLGELFWFQGVINDLMRKYNE